MNRPSIKLDFNHPYLEYLNFYKVPIEKHGEFYERFGYYLYSVSTPEKEKAAAFLWMIKNGKITEKVD
jgi:hypothetical protein